MRFAGDIKGHMGYPGVEESVKVIDEQLQEKQLVPTTNGVRYPQDNYPAGLFGTEGVHPTELPLLRHQHMQSPQGGIAQMAPGMMDGYVDNQGLGPDTGLPYIVGPELQRQRRDSMNQLQQVPPSLLPPNLRRV